MQDQASSANFQADLDKAELAMSQGNQIVARQLYTTTFNALQRQLQTDPENATLLQQLETCRTALAKLTRNKSISSNNTKQNVKNVQALQIKTSISSKSIMDQPKSVATQTTTTPVNIPPPLPPKPPPEVVNAAMESLRRQASTMSNRSVSMSSISSATPPSPRQSSVPVQLLAQRLSNNMNLQLNSSQSRIIPPVPSIPPPKPPSIKSPPYTPSQTYQPSPRPPLPPRSSVISLTVKDVDLDDKTVVDTSPIKSPSLLGPTTTFTSPIQSPQPSKSPTLTTPSFSLNSNLSTIRKNLAFQLDNVDADIKRMNNALATGQDLRTVPLSHPITLSPVQVPSSPHSSPVLAYVDPVAPLRDLKHQMETAQSKVDHLMELAKRTPIHLLKPWHVAQQLSILEQDLFLQIKMVDLIQHKPPTSPSHTVTASTDFFNFVSRIVEHSILMEPTIAMRARVIHVWTKIANHLFQIRNLQTLKAITSAMSTPPIARLKRTWSVVPAKSLRAIAIHQQLLSEQRNYAVYRDWLSKNASRPTIPFVGLYIHDVYYVLAAVKKDAESAGNPTPGLDLTLRDKRIIEISNQLHFYQSGPRYARVSAGKYDNGIPPGQSGNAQVHRESSGLGGLIRGMWASPTNGPQRKSSISGISMSIEDQLSELDDETYSNFAQHWILTRERVSEKEVDELSQQREPKSLDETELGTSPHEDLDDRRRRMVNPTNSGDVSTINSRPASVIESVSTEATSGHERKRSGLFGFLGGSSSSLEPIVAPLSTSTSTSSLVSQSSQGTNLSPPLPSLPLNQTDVVLATTAIQSSNPIDVPVAKIPPGAFSYS